MVNDDVIRFDVFMNDSDDLMTVMNCLEHIDQVVTDLPSRYALRLHCIKVAAFLALFVVIGILCIHCANHVA